MSKFEELTGIKVSNIWKNQTNLKKTYKALPTIERLMKEGETDQELNEIYKELTTNLKHLIERDIKEAFIFLYIVVYGNSCSDIYMCYGKNLGVDTPQELRDIATETLKLMIMCKKDGIYLNEI
ncbi:hypothetical protein SAMN05661008_00350 [Alkalithermobacter thermoalcaliphilus JW-YL-7 = DSM 7308]|uniref:Uncharacterized protein n=1 Tax=Alkalithermobacter thermoalcaliphilus JW-YL-7 = DSM 7308 TaxID=1121328 RepID=A0A150FP99_CLOPD|nr:hypothetical protein JWYL7_0538 [[Clostridium] paradoxum JW-YL-7 = DSM 7308]SHK50670.1 hypothetical protein SAMN05661008_00350 [[Clostridium] paradoxum JW-YL-7 = DSM 7308]